MDASASEGGNGRERETRHLGAVEGKACAMGPFTGSGGRSDPFYRFDMDVLGEYSAFFGQRKRVGRACGIC
jgi:hypothetical protein